MAASAAPLRIVAAILLAQPLLFAAIGISGTDILYSFNGTAMSAARPACVLNTGNETVPAGIRTNDSCVAALFPNGSNETELAPGSQQCISLAPSCASVPASVKITATALHGMVRASVSRSAQIGYAPQAGQSPVKTQDSRTPEPPAAGSSGSAVATSAGSETVLILVIVIFAVSGWYFLRYFYRH